MNAPLEILKAQLFAARAMAEASIQQIDATLAVLGVPMEGDDEGAGVCTHPVDQRVDETTMGGPEGWRCRVCGFDTLTQ